MKITLVDIPSPVIRKSKTEVSSLSLGYPASSLTELGHEVLLLDEQRWCNSYENCYHHLLVEKLAVVGFTSTTANRFITTNDTEKNF